MHLPEGSPKPRFQAISVPKWESVGSQDDPEMLITGLAEAIWQISQ
jgi:hypothetical protein